MPELAPLAVAFALAAVALGGFAQGFSGFGMGLTAMGLLSLLAHDIERVGVAVTTASLAMLLTIIRVSRTDARIDWPMVWLLLAGIGPGFAAGYGLVRAFGTAGWMQAALGVVLVAFAAEGIARRSRPRDLPAWSGVPVGLFSGVLIGAFTSGGPPLVVFLSAREEDPREIKGTLQAVFVVTSLARVAAAYGTGRPIGAELWVWIGLLGATSAAAAVYGHRLSRRVSTRAFKKAVYGLIAVAGVLNIARGLGGL